jgi:hypothetical protein
MSQNPPPSNESWTSRDLVSSSETSSVRTAIPTSSVNEGSVPPIRPVEGSIPPRPQLSFQPPYQPWDLLQFMTVHQVPRHECVAQTAQYPDTAVELTYHSVNVVNDCQKKIGIGEKANDDTQKALKAAGLQNKELERENARLEVAEGEL